MRERPRTRARLRRWTALVVVLAAMVVASTPAVGTGAGSANLLVKTTVRNSISLTNDCGQRLSWGLPVVASADPVTTATGANACRFTFSSNNSTAMLQIYQADRTGSAMSSPPTSWTEKHAGTSFQSLSHAGPGMLIAQDQWAVDGLYRRSTDGGATWETFTPGGTLPTPYTSVVSPNVAWRFGSGAVLVSTDMSAATPSWTASPTSPSSVTGGDAVSSTVAWTINDQTARLTTDGGASWSSGNLNGCANAARIDAVSATVAFATGYGRICRTTIGNATGPGEWTVVSSGIPGNPGIANVMTSPGASTTVWGVGDYGAVVRSTDNGANWAVLTPVPVPVDLSDVEAISATEAYVAGDDGLVFHTTNAGSSWMKVQVPSIETLRDISVAGPASIVAAGLAGITVATHDGGTTWVDVADAGGSNRRDIDSVDIETLIAAGRNGAIEYSGDGGTTWTALDAGVGPYNIRGVAMVSNEEFVGVGDAGTIVVTHNGGVTWEEPASGTTADLWDVDIDSQGVAIAVGDGGTILRSTDFGGSWTTVASSGVVLRRVEVRSGRPIIAVGAAGTIRRSTDRGITWTTPTSPTSRRLESISVPSAYVAYASAPGQLLKSIDAGATWTVRSTGGMGLVDAPSEDTVWMTTGYHDGWAEWANLSTDGGATFTPPFGNQNPDVSYIHAIDAGRVYFGGQRGALRQTDAPATLPDYAPGAWGGSGSVFGVCLQELGGTADADAWLEDLTGVCTADDTDPWNAVTISPTRVAQLTAAGTGSVDLVWGFRAAGSLAPGRYSAGIVVQAIAPNA